MSAAARSPTRVVNAMLRLVLSSLRCPASYAILHYKPTGDARSCRKASANCTQSHEHLHWGPAGGTPQTDPNLRLEAYLDAARRGAIGIPQ
jgi:hypothetical protein